MKNIDFHAAITWLIRGIFKSTNEKRLKMASKRNGGLRSSCMTAGKTEEFAPVCRVRFQNFMRSREYRGIFWKIIAIFWKLARTLCRLEFTSSESERAHADKTQSTEITKCNSVLVTVSSLD